MMNKFLILLIGILSFSCSGGLEPLGSDVQKSYISGTIYYKGGKSGWTKDSVFAIRVVGFKNYPPKDVIGELIAGNAVFTPFSLPIRVDSSAFRIDLSALPIELNYVAVAMQYADSLTAQKAIGVYTTSGNPENPSSILITRGKYFDKVNIYVDFENLPPQPF